jgi:hypothetical protein
MRVFTDGQECVHLYRGIYPGDEFETVPITVKTGIIGPQVSTLVLPLLVRSVLFLFLCLSGGLKDRFFAVFLFPVIQKREF